jgi:hypothetical protein
MWAEGDQLFTGTGSQRERPAPVLDRVKRKLITTPPGFDTAEMSDARAICRYVLNGDYLTMWRRAS